ncbi:hypothetical protein G4Y79_04565 [Phototrophicus methaneseepsis]|uniref:Uncharacterized protein n=1 Tax=Phototrophicus methaneseepsis TaxID=2710758 RepID=A0A7S8EB17_9CHLR|nr:hypothetical protein [Phototrophicus methaneseepsis]QPC83660.1 hypothetical protein G4Y79_04565 [Phototrophicus methaneseepsis]
MTLKAKYNLGDSKYRKIGDEEVENERKQLKYKYTFEQVVAEAETYELVTSVASSNSIQLKSNGEIALYKFENEGQQEFNLYIFEFMESKYLAFRYLVEKSYLANPKKSGLLVLPIYSANRLGFEKSAMVKSRDFVHYLDVLQDRLEADIQKHLNKSISLSEESTQLRENLIRAELLSRNDDDTFNLSNYNSMLKRVRDYWLKHFLQNLYSYEISLANFELWAYRAKQIGILHITEFYPDSDFHGRLVYPLSVVRSSSQSPNFKKIYEYFDQQSNCLFLHQPDWNDGEKFVESLTHAYIETRRSSKSYFVRLANVRERVCYSMKIPEFLFDEYLGMAYRMREELKIRISLEADRLPGDTNMDYIHREPVMIDGKYRNIIAIDYDKDSRL